MPLSASQEGMWFFEEFHPRTSAYNVPCAVRMPGPVDAAALEESINDIVRRHDALRTTIAAADGRPFQTVARELRVRVPLLDLSDLPDAERDAETARLEDEHAHEPFDVQRGPLLRASLLRL